MDPSCPLIGLIWILSGLATALFLYLGPLLTLRITDCPEKADKVFQIGVMGGAVWLLSFLALTLAILAWIIWAY